MLNTKLVAIYNRNVSYMLCSIILLMKIWSLKHASASISNGTTTQGEREQIKGFYDNWNTLLYAVLLQPSTPINNPLSKLLAALRDIKAASATLAVSAPLSCCFAVFCCVLLSFFLSYFTYCISVCVYMYCIQRNANGCCASTTHHIIAV